jgi:hypothetical protein
LSFNCLDAASELGQPLSQVSDDSSQGLREEIWLADGRVVKGVKDVGGLLQAGGVGEAVMALARQEVSQLLNCDSQKMGGRRVGCPEMHGSDTMDVAAKGSSNQGTDWPDSHAGD